MTCIVGLVTSDRRVILGADSAATGNNTTVTVRSPKVFRLGPAVVGASGEFRGAQVLRHALKLPRQTPLDVEAWLVSRFLPAALKAYRKHGVTEAPTRIIGVGGRLFEVAPDFALVETRDGFSASGSGEEYAMGAWHALKGQRWPPIKLLQATLEAAAHFALGVRAPFTYLTAP